MFYNNIFTTGHLLHDAWVEVRPLVGAAHCVPVSPTAVLWVARTGDAEAIISLSHLMIGNAAIFRNNVAFIGVAYAVRGANRFKFVRANDIATGSRCRNCHYAKEKETDLPCNSMNIKNRFFYWNWIVTTYQIHIHRNWNFVEFLWRNVVWLESTPFICAIAPIRSESSRPYS